MLNQPKFSVAYEIERENRAFRYTSDEKIKNMKFVRSVFQGYEIKPLSGDYSKRKFQVIDPNNNIIGKFYLKSNAKKAIFEHLEEN